MVPTHKRTPWVQTLLFMIFGWISGPKSGSFSVIWDQLVVLFSRLFPAHFFKRFPGPKLGVCGSKNTDLALDVLQNQLFTEVGILKLSGYLFGASGWV